MNIQEIINKATNGHKPLFTPEIIKIGSINEHLVYEISKGFGMGMDVMYGVTIFSVKYCTILHDISSGGFVSEDECIGYIKSLKDYEII